jgi:hypothetical protein
MDCYGRLATRPETEKQRKVERQKDFKYKITVQIMIFSKQPDVGSRRLVVGQNPPKTVFVPKLSNSQKPDK